MISTMDMIRGLQMGFPVFFCSFSPIQNVRMLMEIPKKGDENTSFIFVSLMPASYCRLLQQR